MQPSRPYGATHSPAAASETARGARDGTGARTGLADEVRKVVGENPVIVLGRRGCCLCHVALRLLLGLGVNPAVYEVGEEEEGDVMDRLREMISREEDDQGASAAIQFPAVFVGGRLFGGLEKVMTCHISGELEPVLREAGALWL